MPEDNDGIPESALDLVADPREITPNLKIGYPIDGGMLVLDGDGTPIEHLEREDIDRLETEITEWKEQSPSA